MTQLTLPAGVRLVEPPEKPFLVLETSNTLILDWDIDSEAETTLEPELTEDTSESGCCTIDSTEDAITRLVEYANLSTDQLWAVYQTGKGVRAFRLDQEFPTDHPGRRELVSALDPDQKYVISSAVRKHWAARVSHKEGRPDEEIRFLCWIGTGAAMSEQWAVFKLHHELLLEHGLTTTTFCAVVETLEAHLKLPSEDYTAFYD